MDVTGKKRERIKYWVSELESPSYGPVRVNFSTIMKVLTVFHEAQSERKKRRKKGKRNHGTLSTNIKGSKLWKQHCLGENDKLNIKCKFMITDMFLSIFVIIVDFVQIKCNPCTCYYFDVCCQ